MTDGNPISVEGNLATVDPEKRMFTLENKDGVIFVKVTYDPKFDGKMQRQKIGYYEKPVVEMTGDSAASLIDLPFVQRPADFPRMQKTGGQGAHRGGRPYQPRNEKLIVAQCLVKAYTDLYIASNPPDGLDFDAGRTAILEAVEQDTDRVMKAGGA